MNIVFVEEAGLELLDSISYYSSAHPDLGRRFKEEVERCILCVGENPDLRGIRPSGYRRINLHIFPYYIPYITRNNILWVLVVAHAHRKPEYWIRRGKQTEGN